MLLVARSKPARTQPLWLKILRNILVHVKAFIEVSPATVAQPQRGYANINIILVLLSLLVQSRSTTVHDIGG